MGKTKTKGKKPKVVFDQAISANNVKGMVATQAQVKLLKKMYKGKKGRDKRNGEPKSSKGDPVGVVAGEVYQGTVDLVVPALIRLEWKRHYTSGANEESTPLGKGGWTHAYNQWIEVDGERTLLRNGDGGEIAFASLEPRGTGLLRGHRLVVKRGSDRSYVVYDRDTRLYREFVALGPGPRCMLRSIRDPYENSVDLQYDGERLVRIIAPGKREIRLGHDAKKRIARVETWARNTMQQQVTYTYTPAGELATVTDAAGGRESFAYDGLHRMVKATHKNGVNFHYRYDEVHGRCVKTWGDGGLHAVEFTYDLTEQTTTTHGEAAPRLFKWNEDGAVLSETTLDGNVIQAVVYDEDGLVLSRTDATGGTTTYEYDELGNCVKETDPAGNEIVFEYAEDRPIRRVDGLNGERRYGYDAHGSLVSVTTAAGVSQTLTYDGYGRTVGHYGPDGPIVTYDYDEEHNRVVVTDARGAATRFTFDALGYPTTMTDATGRVWRVEYDARRRVVVSHYPDGRRALRKYDTSDHVVELTNPEGGISTCEYIGSGVLARVTYPDGQAWTFTYDKAERLLTIKNPKAEVHEIVYDDLDRIVEETTFDGRVLKYAFDGPRLTRIEYPDGQWRSFKHDALGKVVLEQSPHGPATYERDSLGRLLAAVFEEGGLRFETKYHYDSLGRIVAEEQDGQTIRFEYDRRGRRVARILPGGETTRYEYEPAGMVSVLEHDGTKLVVERDVIGREIAARLPASGVEARTAWSVGDLPVEENVTAPASVGQAARTALSRRGWAYDGRGRLSASSDARWGNARYAYDERNMLVEDAMDGQPRTFFEYDAASSLHEILTDLSRPRQPWAVDAGGLLRRTPDAEYEYDENHNLKRKTDLKDWKPTGTVTEYTWDARQGLREVRLPSGERVRFFYDALGRRCRKEITSAVAFGELPEVREVRFLWDGNVMCQEVDSEHGKRVFVHYPGSFKLIFQQEQGEVFLCLDDIRGVPSALIDSKGLVAWTARHSAWGVRLDEWRDPSRRFARPIESPFRLMGHYFDLETGLSATRTRYFDARTARWLSPDPTGLRGSTNLFMFDGSPTVVVDPWGLVPVTVGGRTPNGATEASGNGPDGGFRTLPASMGGDDVYTTANGFTVFDPYAVAAVRMPFSGNSSKDIRNAWALLQAAQEQNPGAFPDIERAETPSGGRSAQGEDEDGVRYTWHHREDIDEDGVGVLILVRSDIHSKLKHTGGDAVKKAGGCSRSRDAHR